MILTNTHLTGFSQTAKTLQSLFKSKSLVLVIYTWEIVIRLLIKGFLDGSLLFFSLLLMAYILFQKYRE